MPYVPINLPSGVYKNGTEMQAKGRWLDCNLVRWNEGAMQPIRGWTQRGTAVATGKARAIRIWTDNSNNRRTAVGTSSRLYIYSEDGTQYDITPSGFTAGFDDATAATGFGNYTYGTGNYGTQRPDGGILIPATTWSLDNWGSYLVGCSNRDG